jgi:hypothetical protein
VVHLGSVPIDSGGGLGANVAVPGVEIECIDAMFAADTLELDSTFDPIGGVVSHALIVSPLLRRKGAPRWAVEGNLWSPLNELYKKGCQEKTSPLTGGRGDLCLDIQPTVCTSVPCFAGILLWMVFPSFGFLCR